MAGYGSEAGNNGLPVYSEREKGPTQTYTTGVGNEERLTVEGTLDSIIGQAQPITTQLKPGGKVR